MIKTILLLLLCQIPVVAQTIREQTQRHLAAMNNMTTKQVVDGNANRVAIFNGRQVPSRKLPVPKFGLLLGSAWYSILEDSQRWVLHPQDDYFTYSTDCLWFEVSRNIWFSDSRWEGWVRCEGRVYVEKTNIVRITQHLYPNRLTKTVSLDIRYDWVQLREPRLLPARMTMDAEFKNGKTSRVEVQWTDYREFGAELLAKEINPDEPPVIGIVSQRNFFDEAAESSGPVAGSNKPTIEIQPTSSAPLETTNLLLPTQPEKVTKEGLSRWKKLYRRFFLPPQLNGPE